MKIHKDLLKTGKYIVGLERKIKQLEQQREEYKVKLKKKQQEIMVLSKYRKLYKKSVIK